MRRALVTGVGGPAGFSLARQLAHRGVAVWGVDMRSCVGPAGVEVVRVPPADSPEFSQVLSELVASESIDLVIPTVTEELIVLAGADLGCPIVIGDRSAVTVADDKYLTYRRLAEAGVPVPLSATPHDADDAFAAQVGSPVLSKPRIGRGGRGVEIHDRPLAEIIDTLEPFDIIQEFVPGTEYAPNVYIADDPGDDVVVVLEKLALANGRHGNARGVMRVEGTRGRDVAVLAVNAARAIGLRGPADIDIRRRADGTAVVLEINARFGANSAHAPEILDRVLAARTLAMRRVWA